MEVMMSEFDKLKDDAEQYAREHPEQVQKGEQAVGHAAESKFGIGGEGRGGQQEGSGEEAQDTQDSQGAQQGDSGSGQ
jgi:hypothetical protein